MTDSPVFVYEEKFLSQIELTSLKKLLDVEEDRFIESQVYNRTKEINIINKHLRSSEKIEYKDDQIFDWVDDIIINKINKINTDFTYVLLRDDVEVVKYTPGDFFKKHQDFVNFDSNEFKSYTFLICLQDCEKGGETSLYVNDKPVVIKGTGKNPGAMLMFKKETVHEGNIIEKGIKMIFKGNMICFNNIKKYEDLIIIKIIKSPGKIYVLPLSVLKYYQDCVYHGFYSFQKKITPEKTVFYYDEEMLDDKEFQYFYERIMLIDMSEKLKEKMDYIGFKFPEVIVKYNKFYDQSLTDKKEDMFMCTTKDYYALLPAMNSDNILPFQLVSFESAKNSVIIWCGFYNNLFGTVDRYFYPGKKPATEETVRKYFHKRHGTSYLGYDARDQDVTENFKVEAQEEFLPNAHFLDRPKDEKLYAMTRKFLWDRVGLKPMSEVSNFHNKNPHKQLNNYVLKMSLQSYVPDVDDDSRFIKNKKAYKVLEEDVDTTYPEIKINQDLLKKIDINKVIERIAKTDMTSYLSKASISEYSCNETNYTSYDVVYRFGCLKINESYYKKD